MFPLELNDLHHLEKLDLSGNKNINLKWQKWMYFPHLIELNLSSSNFPLQLKGLYHIEKLDLSETTTLDSDWR